MMSNQMKMTASGYLRTYRENYIYLTSEDIDLLHALVDQPLKGMCENAFIL